MEEKNETVVQDVSPNYKGKHPLSKEELAAKRKKKPVYESDDPAINPSHYKSKNGLEVIDFIEAFTADLNGFEAYLTGSAMKYLCRWKNKNGLQDCKKSLWFISKLVRYLEEQEKQNNN